MPASAETSLRLERRTAKHYSSERNRMKMKNTAAKTKTVEQTLSESDGTAAVSDITRYEILRFRVTPDERSRIEHKALSSYRTLSRYLRDCSLGKEIKTVPGVDAMVSELRRIGNNLNQLARAVNSGYAPDSSTIASELGEIQKGVKQIWQSLNSLSRDAR